MPTRLKIGENEAAWEGVQDFVERVADETPREAQPALLDALSELAEAAPQLAAAGVGAVTYETQIVDMINGVINTLPGGQVKFVFGLVENKRTGRPDLHLEAPNRTVLVEIRSSTKMLSPDSVEYLFRQINDLGEERPRPVAALLVTRTPLRPDAFDVLRGRHDVYYVHVKGAQDFDRLEKAIRNAVGLQLRT